MASFDQTIKGILKWNVEAFAHLYKMFQEMPNVPEAKSIMELCTIGVKQNYALLRSLANVQFMAADDESQEWAAEQAEQMERRELEPSSHGGEPKAGRVKDIDELNRLYSLELAEKRIAKIDPTWYEAFLKKEHEFGTTNTGSVQGSGETKGTTGTPIQDNRGAGQN